MENINNTDCKTPEKQIPNAAWEYALTGQILGMVQSFLNLFSVQSRIEEMKKDAESDNFNETKFMQDCEFLKKAHEENLRFQIKSVRNQLVHLREQQDFHFFCERFWLPLFKMTVNSLELPLKELLEGPVGNIRIQLLLAWTPSLQKHLSSRGINASDNYDTFCQEFKKRFSDTGVFSTSFINGWQKCSTGVTSDAMLLYYVMRGIPSVVLFFKEEHGYACVEAVFWGLNGGVNEFVSARILELPLPEDKKEKFIGEMLYSTAALIGDSMRKGLINAPFELRDTLTHQISFPYLLEMVKADYEDIESSLDSPVFKFIN